MAKSPFGSEKLPQGLNKDHPWMVRGRRWAKKVNGLQETLPHQRREWISKERELQLAQGDPETSSRDIESKRDAWCSWIKTILLGCQLESCISAEPVSGASPKKLEFSDVGGMLQKAAAGCDLQVGSVQGKCFVFFSWYLCELTLRLLPLWYGDFILVLIMVKMLNSHLFHNFILNH